MPCTRSCGIDHAPGPGRHRAGAHRMLGHAGRGADVRRRARRRCSTSAPGDELALDEIRLWTRAVDVARRAQAAHAAPRDPPRSARQLNSMRGFAAGSAERRLTRPRDFGCSSTASTVSRCAWRGLSSGHQIFASMRTGLHMSWMSGCASAGCVRITTLQLLICVAMGPVPNSHQRSQRKRDRSARSSRRKETGSRGSRTAGRRARARTGSRPRPAGRPARGCRGCAARRPHRSPSSISSCGEL